MALGRAGGLQAPDLRADPVEAIVSGPAVDSNTEGGSATGRLLLRFDGFVTNVGGGPARGLGQPPAGPGDSSRSARWRRARGRAPTRRSPVATAQVQYEEEDAHDHFHLERAMRYSLWNEARTAQVAPGQKVGFCLYDLEDAPGFSGPGRRTPGLHA